MSAIWPVAMHDRSRMPELQPDLETETVHAVERMTMHAAEVTLFGMSGLSWPTVGTNRSAGSGTRSQPPRRCVVRAQIEPSGAPHDELTLCQTRPDGCREHPGAHFRSRCSE